MVRLNSCNHKAVALLKVRRLAGSLVFERLSPKSDEGVFSEHDRLSVFTAGSKKLLLCGRGAQRRRRGVVWCGGVEC